MTTSLSYCLLVQVYVAANRARSQSRTVRLRERTDLTYARWIYGLF